MTWVIAATCLLVPISMGCHGSGAVCHHPAFEQIEQGCYGYEPTLWRSMPGDCQQAIRLVTEEVVETPEPTMAPSQPEMTTPPRDEAAAPDEATIDAVPDSGPLDVPRIVAPPAEQPAPKKEPVQPPVAKPPAVSPAEVPDVPKPEADGTSTLVPMGPAITHPVVTPANTRTRVKAERPERQQFAPVINGPVAQVSARQASAGALFRTVSQALSEPPQPGRIAKQPAAANLSRFISN
jgi:hypothetical protein